MSKRYATGFDVPLLHEGYPLTLTISISHFVTRALYFERSYISASGTVLAVRSTPIEARGVVHLTEFGPTPPGTVRLTACVTSEYRATEADPAVPVAPAEAEGPKFATHLDVPVLFDGKPLMLALGIGPVQQALYLERTYLDGNKQEIGRRSDAIYDRKALVGFNIHRPAPFAGTRWINVCLTNTYNPGTDNPEEPGFIVTLEYTEEEHNYLEYN